MIHFKRIPKNKCNVYENYFLYILSFYHLTILETMNSIILKNFRYWLWMVLTGFNSRTLMLKKKRY